MTGSTRMQAPTSMPRANTPTRTASPSAWRCASVLNTARSGPELIKDAAKEALKGYGFDLLVICGFAFDAMAGETVQEFTPELPKRDERFAAARETRMGKLPILLARMNPDLSMGDALLKKTGAGNLFMVFGEPDIDLKKRKDGKIVVSLKGLDVYDPTTGQIRNSSTDDIACWFVNTDYNEESFFVRHAYFTGAGDPYEKLKRALRAEIDEGAWSALYSTTSRPFDPPGHGQDRGQGHQPLWG